MNREMISLLFPDEHDNMSPYGRLPGEWREQISISNEQLDRTLKKAFDAVYLMIREAMVLTGRKSFTEEETAIYQGMANIVRRYKGESKADQLQLVLYIHDNFTFNLKTRLEDDKTDFGALNEVLSTRANKVVALVLNEFENMVINAINPHMYMRRD